MAKQSNQKLKLLYLLKILFDSTDEQTGLTITQLSAELAKYNISAGRKSLYDDIESLRLFGVDVKVKRDRYVRYYIAKREFSMTELRYVVDALNSFDAIYPCASYELTSKLVKLHGGKERAFSDNLTEPLYKTPKAVYDELRKNIELLNVAISNQKMISCKQFVWNSFKQRVFINDGKPLSVTPIRLVCEERYILYAYDGKCVSRYDVDSLINMEILKDDAAPYDEYRELLSDPRYDVEYENVRLECDNFFAGEVFVRFGLGVTVLSNREETFEISVKVKLDDKFFAWLFVNAKHVRVVSPERVKDFYKQKLLLAIDNIDRQG